MIINIADVIYENTILIGQLLIPKSTDKIVWAIKYETIKGIHLLDLSTFAGNKIYQPEKRYINIANTKALDINVGAR